MNSVLYRALNQKYFKGDFIGFQKLYDQEHEEFHAPSHFLAARTFQELGLWQRSKSSLNIVIIQGNEIERSKASLLLDSIDFVIEKQSRFDAEKILLKCSTIQEKFDSDEISFFVSIVRIRIKAALITLGLMSADRKKDLLKQGEQLLDDNRTKFPEEAMDLLLLLMNHSLSLPLSNPSGSLVLFKKYATTANETPWRLTFHLQTEMMGTLQSQYVHRHTLHPGRLPRELESLQEALKNSGHAYPEAIVKGIYGAHLLELEYAEGLNWISDSINTLWDFGNNSLALSYKTKCINWLGDRGLKDEMHTIDKELSHIASKETTPFAEDLKQLNLSNQHFAAGDYAAGEQVLRIQLEKLESETNRVHFISLLANNASKIDRTKRFAFEQITKEIDRLDVKQSPLYAQLLTFKAIVSGKELKTAFFLEAAECYQELGYFNDAIQQFKNYLSEIRTQDLQLKVFTLNNQIRPVIQNLDRLFLSTAWIKNPLSSEASVLQFLGQTDIIAGQYENGIKTLSMASDKYVEAHFTRAAANNTQYAILAMIQLGRITKDVQHYNKAILEGKKAVPILEKNELNDFLWRLLFHLAICHSEPLRYNLIKPEDSEHYIDNARFYYKKSLQVYQTINDFTQKLDNDKRLFASSNLSKEARQLVFSGFYFFLEIKDYRACINWLESNRNRSLMINNMKIEESDFIQTLQSNLSKRKREPHWFAYYYVHKSDIFLFLLNGNLREPIVNKLILSEEQLKRLSSLSSDEFPSISGNYQKLIEPLEQYTSPGEMICIITYGNLSNLPFQMLQIDNLPLSVRNPIYFNFSLGLWNHQNQETEENLNKVQIFADPRNDLENAPEEAIKIGEAFGQKPVLGEEVNKEKFLRDLEEETLIHFAGHGQSTTSPNLEDSFIEMSGSEIISAKDIINQKNRAPLVVLSSCNTGRHEVLGGEEKSGMVYALMLSGIKATISSVWEVDDEGTTDYFSAFYSEIIKGENAATALWKANQTTYKKGKKSKTTLGFILTGYPFSRLKKL